MFCFNKAVKKFDARCIVVYSETAQVWSGGKFFDCIMQRQIYT